MCVREQVAIAERFPEQQKGLAANPEIERALRQAMANSSPPLLRGLTAAITRIICCALVVLPCLYVSSKHHAQEILQRSDPRVADAGAALQSPGARTAAVNRTAPEQMELSGQSLIIERVPDPRGVLLTFHGCSHSALDWWHPQPSCSKCVGLPEETAIVAVAVARRYVVVAFSSQDRDGSKCWAVGPPPDQTPDVMRTVANVAQLAKAENWGPDLPIYALGASSGGSMVALLPFHLKLQGICVQISGVPAKVYKGVQQSLAWPFPPALFVHMPRDQHTAAIVAADVAALEAEGVATREVKIEPLPLPPGFFADRIEGVSAETSAQMVAALRDGGLLDEAGKLTSDPRRTADEWHKLLKDKVPVARDMSFAADKSPVPEVLNVAWAGHEIVSDTTDTMLDWFETQQAASLS